MGMENLKLMNFRNCVGLSLFLNDDIGNYGDQMIELYSKLILTRAVYRFLTEWIYVKSFTLLKINPMLFSALICILMFLYIIWLLKPGELREMFYYEIKTFFVIIISNLRRHKICLVLVIV